MRPEEGQALRRRTRAARPLWVLSLDSSSCCLDSAQVYVFPVYAQNSWYNTTSVFKQKGLSQHHLACPKSATSSDQLGPLHNKTYARRLPPTAFIDSDRCTRTPFTLKR